MTRLWIKVWVNECLDGTIRFDFTPEERCVWYDLLILAGRCRSEGMISAGKGTPYPKNWIAGTLNIPLELLEKVLVKCQETQRICLNGDGIQIINWKKYQSEYDRQLKSRLAKQRDEDPTKFKKGKYGHMVNR